jgi:HK97 family phage major capsid protein
MATYAEQIGAYENKRAANVAAMAKIMEKSAEVGATLDAADQEEFDTLDGDNDAIDKHLDRLRKMETANIATAKPVTAKNGEEGAAQRQVGSIQVKNPVLPKGTAFARYVGAIAHTKGDREAAARFAANRWKDSTPEVEMVLRTDLDLIEKTAVNAGTTTDSTWAAPLVVYNNMQQEFIDYLRPLTIIGRINGFRRVPFKTKVPRQTSGATVNWVGEGKVKPLTSLAFDTVTLEHHKVAGIIPLTEELVKFSNPGAEELVRSDLASAIAQFLDVEFIDVTNASTDVSPASVTYGLTPIVASGTTAAAFRYDVKQMFAQLLTANLQIAGGVWVMTQQQAVALAMMQNSLGQAEFPGISVTGGTLLGFPVITSENVPATGGSPTDGYAITFILPGEILLADDGGVMVDISREATLQMETTPDSPFSASTSLVSLWQHNMVAVKVERFITWQKRRTNAAALIASAKYSE